MKKILLIAAALFTLAGCAKKEANYKWDMPTDTHTATLHIKSAQTGEFRPDLDYTINFDKWFYIMKSTHKVVHFPETLITDNYVDDVVTTQDYDNLPEFNQFLYDLKEMLEHPIYLSCFIVNFKLNKHQMVYKK